MKRRVILVLLLLVAGAIVNVAVAWGCEYEHVTPPLSPPPLPPQPWKADEINSDAAQMIYEHECSMYGWATSRERRFASSAMAYWYGDSALDVFEAGWPCLSVASSRSRNRDEFRFQWSISVPTGSSEQHLPLRPIWPGFAINTVFYAGVLWLLFAAPFALRRRRRIKRGLCPKCAYDLRGTPQGATSCPECGATVTGSSAE